MAVLADVIHHVREVVSLGVQARAKMDVKDADMNVLDPVKTPAPVAANIQHLVNQMSYA